MHDGNGAIPLLLLFTEMSPSECGDVIESGFAIVLGYFPRRPYKSTLLQTHQAGVQRSHIQTDSAGGYLFEAGGDRIPVQRPQSIQGLQDHQVERSLQYVALGLASIRHANDSGPSPI